EIIFFFSSRRRHTRFSRDWSSDVCSSDLYLLGVGIYSSLHLTIETIQAIRSCNQVFILHDDPMVLNYIKNINPNIIDCYKYYIRSEERRVGKDVSTRLLDFYSKR